MKHQPLRNRSSRSVPLRRNRRRGHRDHRQPEHDVRGSRSHRAELAPGRTGTHRNRDRNPPRRERRLRPAPAPHRARRLVNLAAFFAGSTLVALLRLCAVALHDVPRITGSVASIVTLAARPGRRRGGDVMIRRLLAAAYDYCERCGWWVRDCPHQYRPHYGCMCPPTATAPGTRFPGAVPRSVPVSRATAGQASAG